MTVALVVAIVVVVALVALVVVLRRPDPVDEPAPLESNHAREAVRAAIERREAR